MKEKKKKTYRRYCNALHFFFFPFFRLHWFLFLFFFSFQKKKLLKRLDVMEMFDCIHERPSGRGLTQWRWLRRIVCIYIYKDDGIRILSDNSAGNLRQCDMPNSCAARILRRNERSLRPARLTAYYMDALCGPSRLPPPTQHQTILQQRVSSLISIDVLPRFFFLS